MRILICGGRDFDDWGLFTRTLVNVCNTYSSAESPSEFISGGARGADAMITSLAKAWNKPCQIFMADWKKYGRRAGPIRNQQMLDEGKPDLVVAFPGGVGTADMVTKAKKAGVKVIEVESE